MNHFRTEEWIDLVNRTSSEEQMAVIEEHLAGGCKKCAEQVGLWQKVRNFASVEPTYQPPEQAVRNAQALFNTAAWVSGLKERINVELLFDSLFAPAYSGARTAGTGVRSGTAVRQLLYRADSLQIDLRVEAMPGNRFLLVTGQVLDVARPEKIGSGLEVTLSNQRGSLVQALTNEFGEFHVEIQNSGDLELALPSASEKPIVISLKDPLGDLPGDDT